MKKLLSAIAAVGLLAGCTAPQSEPDSTQQPAAPQRVRNSELTLTHVVEFNDSSGYYMGKFGCFGTTGIYVYMDNSPMVVIPKDEHCPAQ